MATRPKAIIESRNGEKFSPITIAKNVLTDDGQNLHDILSDRKEDMMTPTIESSSSMFKVGQGDSVDYSANVVNGAYESMVLKGKSMVNCIQEPSSKDVVLPYEFAESQYVTINDTKESGALGVELKGQTLVNLCQNLGNETSTSTGMLLSGEISVKTNATYMVVAKVKSSNPLSSIPFSSFLRVDSITTGKILGGVTGDITTAYTTKSFTFNTGNTTTVKINLRNAYGDWGLTANTSYAKEVMLIEYQDGMENWDIPYFTGMISCKMPILKSVNQLFDYSLITAPGESLSFTNDGRKIRVDFNTRRDCYQHVDLTIPSGTYNVSFEIRGNISSVSNMDRIHTSKLGLAFVGNSNDGWSGNAPKIDAQYVNLSQSEFTTVTKSFTFDESKKVTIYYHGWNDNPVGWCEFRNIRIVPQGKTSILSLPEEVVLRSLPNGVCDTFNTRTGVYTQRIGDDTFTGTSNENWIIPNNYTTGNTLPFRIKKPTMEGNGNVIPTDIICDKMKIETPRNAWGNDNYDKEGLSHGTGKGDGVDVRILKSKLTTHDVAGFKAWLSQNPIRVQYQLHTPVITKINLSSTLKSWNTTTHIYSEIPENTLYPILSHSSNPTYPVILKPSTKYSIVANSYSNSHTNSAINFNLGGATASTTVGNRVTTITTPSTLSNELLTMSGHGNKLNNVMVIEGDVVGNEPYFEGMCDCKSPILSNVGKNLFNIDGKFIKGAYSFGIPVLNSSDQVIEKIGENSLHITCGTNFYHSGWGQIIDVKNLDSVTISVTSAFSSSLTTPELKVLCLYESEEVPVTMDGQKKTDYDSRCLTQTLNDTNKTYTRTINTRGFAKVYVLFTGGYKAGGQGIFDFTLHNIYVGEESIHHGYEPYKSNAITFDQKDGKTIVLRSLPNGVCDTLNVETGEYVQKIGEVVFDGTNKQWEVLAYPPHNNNTHYQFKHQLGEGVIGGGLWANAQSILSNTLPSASESLHWRGNGNYGIGGDSNSIMITWKKDTSPFNDVVTLNEWLKKNPTTVQYELATPIVSTIDIQGFPYAYTNGHVQLSSSSIEQSLTPKVEYSVATNRNGQIRSNQKMIERHQKQLDRLQAMVLTNLVNTQYEQTLTNLKYDLKNVREEVK